MKQHLRQMFTNTRTNEVMQRHLAVETHLRQTVGIMHTIIVHPIVIDRSIIIINTIVTAGHLIAIIVSIVIIDMTTGIQKIDMMNGKRVQDLPVVIIISMRSVTTNERIAVRTAANNPHIHPQPLRYNLHLIHLHSKT